MMSGGDCIIIGICMRSGEGDGGHSAIDIPVCSVVYGRDAIFKLNPDCIILEHVQQFYACYLAILCTYLSDIEKRKHKKKGNTRKRQYGSYAWGWS